MAMTHLRACGLLVIVAACRPVPAPFVSPPRHSVASGEPETPEIATPADLYGELFTRVQREAVYPDSKTFVDALPVRAPEQIMAEFLQARTRRNFNLRDFVSMRFRLPQNDGTAYQTIAGQDVRAHIDRLWSVLERRPDQEQPYTSRLPLPARYIVPGGRFNEIYYWDSYFTMLGLERSGRHDVTISMLKNFAHLIDRYGHIPNGNRSYYLSRSQPPFFAAMVELVASSDGEQVLREYLPQLTREYAYWMNGAETLMPQSAHRRVVRLDDGTLLNRYWDDRDTPREEAYREDVATAQASGRPPAEVFRNLRAAAESGWDFSSRWLADGKTLATIRTTELIPPDLNSLLFELELTIAVACSAVGDEACAQDMRAKAGRRRVAIERLLWNPAVNAYTDFDWRAQRPTNLITAATLYPLYFKVTEKGRAHTVATTVREHLLQPGGLATTTQYTGQQWDMPNGWAPLQWIAIQGLTNFGEGELAGTVAQRWALNNLDVFRRTGKLVEKYDVCSTAGGQGGEYPNQDGFGWTNGVLRELLARYPGYMEN